MRSVRTDAAQRGFTLIEVLVAVLVLAIGLVGIAGLQVFALKANQSAYMRSQATALAYSLGERMRSNVPAAEDNAYDPAAASAIAGCVSSSGCSSLEMAQHDLAEWRDAVAAHLPMGTGIVCLDSTPSDGNSPADPACDGSAGQHTVKIWWDDNRDGEITVSPDSTERVAVTFRL
jgi:type IV pilus assembly protein PilV